MSNKTKPKHPPAPKPGTDSIPLPGRLPPGADQRWQRTVRFNWDKGGSKGGRK